MSQTTVKVKNSIKESTATLIKEVEKLVFENNEFASDVMFRSSLNYLKAKLKLKGADKEVLKRFEQIREGALSIASLDFSKEIPLSGEDDILNYFAILLNHLSQALQLKIYDDEGFVGEASNSDKQLCTQAIELLCFYKYHALYTKSGNNSDLKKHFNLLEDVLKYQDMSKLCIKYSNNPSAMNLLIDKAFRTLSAKKVKSDYIGWSKVSLPILILTNKQFKLLEAEIKYNTITRMAIRFDVFKQLEFFSVDLDLKKRMPELNLSKKVLVKIRKLGVYIVKDLLKYNWEEIKEKAKLNSKESIELMEKLQQLKCFTLLEQVQYSTIANNSELLHELKLN